MCFLSYRGEGCEDEGEVLASASMPGIFPCR
jgi:hypothetical protein